MIDIYKDCKTKVFTTIKVSAEIGFFFNLYHSLILKLLKRSKFNGFINRLFFSGLLLSI